MSQTRSQQKALASWYEQLKEDYYGTWIGWLLEQMGFAFVWSILLVLLGVVAFAMHVATKERGPEWMGPAFGGLQAGIRGITAAICVGVSKHVGKQICRSADTKLFAYGAVTVLALFFVWIYYPYYGLAEVFDPTLHSYRTDSDRLDFREGFAGVYVAGAFLFWIPGLFGVLRADDRRTIKAQNCKEQEAKVAALEDKGNLG